MSPSGRSNRTLIAPLVLASVAFGAGCQGFGVRDSRPIVPITDYPSWEEPIADLFDGYCGECHSSPPRRSAPAYFRTDAYDDRGSAAGVVTMFGAHLARIGSSSNRMPPPAFAEVSAAEVRMLERWQELGFARTVEEALAAGGAVVGGGTIPRCEPATVAPCACPGGVWGRQTCLDDGTYAVCACTPGSGGGDAGVDAPTDAGAGPSLQQVVSEVFEPHCNGAGCHSPGETPPDLGTVGGLRDRLLRSSLQARPMPYVAPGNPEGSYLYVKSTPDFESSGVGSGRRMPQDQPVLDAAALTLLYEWIAAGGAP